MKLAKLLRFLFVLACSPTTSCADSSQVQDENTTVPFSILLDGVDCPKQENNIQVPTSGKEYLFKIKAENNLTWSAELQNVSEGWLTTESEGTHQGNSELTIKAASCSDPNKQYSGILLISNLKSKVNYRFYFKKVSSKEFLFPLQDKEGFENGTGRLTKQCKLESEDMVLLWDKTLGTKPTKFDPEDLLKQMQEGFDFMIDKAGFANRTTSIVNKYKLVGIVRDDEKGTAITYNKAPIAVFELSLNRARPKNKYGYNGAMHHELCHSFQFIAQNDGSPMGIGTFGEMTSQWSLLKKYTDWGDLENGHLKAYLKLAHLTLMDEENQYHSPYVLEYWEMKHDKIVSRIWKEANKADNYDPIACYKRLTGIDQTTFNDEIFDACRRFITWDIPRIAKDYAKYANLHICKVRRTTNNQYRSLPEFCPENYGYNSIKLNVPTGGTTIKVGFKGNIKLQGFTIKKDFFKGWRYGLVAMTKEGKRVYSDIHREDEKQIAFIVPQNTTHLWLVVMGAPTEHWKYKEGDESQWPYEFTLEGTNVDNSFLD